MNRTLLLVLAMILGCGGKTLAGTEDGAAMSSANDAETSGSRAHSGPDGSACPAECSNNCEDETCEIDINCPGTSPSCTVDGLPQTCPPGLPCDVMCIGPNSCDDTKIECATGEPCTLECSGPYSCGRAIVKCPSEGPCVVSCTGREACQALDVMCGTGPCTVTCSPVAAGIAAGPQSAFKTCTQSFGPGGG
jgi:hypothetical protein